MLGVKEKDGVYVYMRYFFHENTFNRHHEFETEWLTAVINYDINHCYQNACLPRENWINKKPCENEASMKDWELRKKEN